MRSSSGGRRSGRHLRTRRALGPSLAVEDGADAACTLDLLARGLRERVRVHGQLLGELALAQDLHRDALARGQAPLLERVRSDLGAVVEARLEVTEIHRLGVRAEVLEGHRLLHVRTAQLAHPHVDRHLAALEGGPALRARARARTVLAAAGGLAQARALAAPHALAGVARAWLGLQRVESDVLSHARPPRPS